MLRNFFKVALRNLIRYKMFSFINLAGLAIGLACFIFIALFIQDELSYDRFHEKHEQIYRLVNIERDGDGTTGTALVSAPWGPALQEAIPEIAASVRFRFYSRALVSAGEKQFYESNGLFADASVFDIFTFPMVHGDSRTALAQPNSVVLTQAMAQRYFGDENPVGKSLQFDTQESYQVTGVVEDVPDNAHFRFDFLVSFATYEFWDLTEWRTNNFHNYVLLSPGASPASAEAKIPAVLKSRMGEDDFEAMESVQKLQPLTRIHLHSHLFREFEPNSDIAYVYLFAAIGFFILLIACINFMNLSTARASKRSMEVGMRKVVGAQQQQLMRQFLGESLFFALLALIMAICLVELLMPAFRQLVGRELSFDLFGNPLFFAGLLAVALLTGLLSGSYPALFLSAFKPIHALQGKSLTNRRSPLRKTLVVVQFAISIALIASTIVVFRQLAYVQNKKLGFDKEQVLVVRIADSEVEADPEPFLAEIGQRADVLSASATDNLLGGSDWGMPFRYQGAEAGELFLSRVLAVDANFLETMDMEIIVGRDFSTAFADDQQEAFILNETAVRELGWESPIGRYLERPTGRGADGNWQWQRGPVVGVVKDFNFRSLHSEVQPLTLFLKRDDVSYVNIKIAGGNLTETLAGLEKTWLQFAPARPFDFYFLDQVFDQMYRAEHQLSQIFMTFSVLAIFIGCLGLLGLMSFMAEQRTKEIGVRKVLGASVTNIILLLSKEFVSLIAVAFLIAGAVAYWAMDEWLHAFAYRISLSPDIFLLAGVLTLLVALLTVAFQAVKASLANPVEALRYE